MTSEQAALRVRKFGERNAMAVSLAQMLSFAALADPALVRRMRLDLLPGSSAADEADLWFSNLVQSRSPAGLVFFPEVAEILRRGLPPESRQEAWERTRHVHRHARRAIRIEEELTYLGLDADTNRARIDELLRDVISALMGGRSELANWAGRAVPRLPSAVQNFESASVLRIAADLRLGRNPDLRGRLAAFDRIPASLAAVLPRLGRIRLGVTLANGEISLGPLLRDPNSPVPHSIEVPDTPTVAVEVRWTASGRSKILFVEKDEISPPEKVDAGPIELVTLANETWTLHPSQTVQDRPPVAPLSISAYTDGYAVTLHWRSREEIPGCLGFAVMRRRRTGTSNPEPEEVLSASGAPSTHEPYQRFDWIDRPTPRETEYSYRVVPMAGQPGELHPLEERSSAWTAFIRVGPQTDAPTSVAFNRTFEDAASLGLSTQDIGQLSPQSFHDMIAQPGNPVRQALGGDLLSSLIALLSQAESYSSTVFVAMFELDDPEILQLLEKLGKRANIVLSNGAARPQQPDFNLDVRLRLKRGGVQVWDRIFPAGRLGHNKFLVVVDSAGQPNTVWTGNVSWMSAALCARSNAAVTVIGKPLAEAYLNYWNRLTTPSKAPALAARSNENISPALVGNASVRPWFTPALNFADIEAARECIRNARQGVLFLLSEPGQRGSVVPTILEQDNLYIMGAIRSGPGLTLYRNRQQVQLHGKQLSFPVFGVTAEAKSPSLPLGSTLQSRMIVVDPLGSHPVVLIGSHAFGERGSRTNDENFLIVENDPEMARRCAAHIEAYCQHYRFRINLEGASAGVELQSGDSWQKQWFQPDRQGELAFWMAEDSRTFTAPAPVASVSEPVDKPPAAKAVRPSKTVRRKPPKAAAKAPAKPATKKATSRAPSKARSETAGRKSPRKAKPAPRFKKKK